MKAHAPYLVIIVVFAHAQLGPIKALPANGVQEFNWPGRFFAFLSSIIGWLGVAVTGYAPPRSAWPGRRASSSARSSAGASACCW